MEIQFINTMEASNMRHDVMARRHEWQQRVDTLAAERAKKNEEKAAKEAAAEERRKTAEIVCQLGIFWVHNDLVGRGGRKGVASFCNFWNKGR